MPPQHDENRKKMFGSFFSNNESAGMPLYMIIAYAILGIVCAIGIIIFFSRHSGNSKALGEHSSRNISLLDPSLTVPTSELPEGNRQLLDRISALGELLRSPSTSNQTRLSLIIGDEINQIFKAFSSPLLQPNSDSDSAFLKTFCDPVKKDIIAPMENLIVVHQPDFEKLNQNFRKAILRIDQDINNVKSVCNNVSASK